VTAYADPEMLISTWLGDHLGIKTWCDPVLPPTWRFDAPIAHVQRGPGVETPRLTLDDVTLDIDVYAADAQHARDTAGRVWSAMILDLPTLTLPGSIFVKYCSATTQPMWAPDPSVYRRTAAYRVILHGYLA